MGPVATSRGNLQEYFAERSWQRSFYLSCGPIFRFVMKKELVTGEGDVHAGKELSYFGLLS